MTRLTASGRRGLQDPRQYAGLFLHMRVRDKWQESTFATDAALEGDPVGALSVPGRRVNLPRWVQATSGKRPTLLLAATPGGQNALHFDGAAQQSLAAASFPDPNWYEHTAYVVIRPTITPTAAAPVLAASGQSNWYVGATTTDRVIASWRDNGATVRTLSSTAGDLLINSWQIIGFRLKAASSLDYTTGAPTVTFLLSNGTQHDTVVSASVGLQLPVTTTWRIGALSDTGNPFTGDVAGIDAYVGAQTDAQMAAIMAELKREFAIT